MNETAEPRSDNRLDLMERLWVFTDLSFRFYGMLLLAGSAFILLPFLAVSHNPADPLIADRGMLSSSDPENWFAQLVMIFCDKKLFSVRLVAALCYWLMVPFMEPLDGPGKVGFYVLCLNNVVIIGMIVGCCLWA